MKRELKNKSVSPMSVNTRNLSDLEVDPEPIASVQNHAEPGRGNDGLVALIGTDTLTG